MRWSETGAGAINTHAGRFFRLAHHGPFLRCQAYRERAFAFLAPRIGERG